MIHCLTFEPAVPGRDWSAARFAPRSNLPLSAACVVANGVREQLCRALATEFEVRVIEPAVPGAAGRALLLAGATILRVGGRLCDAFVCVRPLDARRLVALAFGETEPREGTALSAIERTTLERVVLGLVPLCNALCGPLGTATPERAERAASELVSYFEVRAAAREPFAIGFGLTRDPAPEVTECITLDALSDVELQGRVEVGTGRVGVPAFARLAPQTTLAFDAPLEGNAVLRFGEVVFARGTCGVVDGRNALRIGFGESSAA